MTVVRTDINFLMRLLKKRLNSEKILEALEQIGTDPELLDNELVVEIYPNRPDMYSPEGIARALRAYLEISPGLPRFNVRNGDLKIIVKKSVLNIRPYIAGAVVRDVSLDEEALESIMRLQEALHDSYGRKRRRVAIGIHDLDKVTPPFTYRGISPDGVRFVPLGFDVEMTPREVLEKHPKGVEYGHIIKDKDAYPLIIDRRGNVLSMPPIINGELTRVTTKTKNIFIDVTGTHLDAVIGAAEIVAAAISEYGSEIERVIVEHPSGTIVTPELSFKEIRVPVSIIREILGLSLSKEDIERSLRKMMYDVLFNDDEIIAKYPTIRRDILHPIDVVEDIAIGYGYEALGEELPREYSQGIEDMLLEELDVIREIMVGLGFLEVITFTLVSDEYEFDKLRLKRAKAARILNPITSEMTIVRRSLLPSLLKVLHHNKDEELPLRVFEVGEVVNEKYKNEYRLAFVVMDTKIATFNEIRKIIEAFFRYYCGSCITLRMHDDPRFIPGRSAEILVNDIPIGIFGEIHPEVLENFDIPYPVVAAEVKINEIIRALHSRP